MIKKLLSIYLTALSSISIAQTVDTTDKDHQLQIGIAAVSSQSIYVGGKNQLRVFPAIDYKYQRFYFQAGDLGLNLFESDNWEINSGIGINLAGDQDRGDSRLLADLPNLSIPLSAFVSIQYKTSIGLFKVKHDYEINNKHNGNSSSFSYSAPIRQGSWLLIPQLSFEHHSSEVVNYFYGINAADATAQLPAYQTGAVNNWQLSFMGLRQINNKWSFVGSIQNEFLGDEISNSPIVDQDNRLAVFAGFLYKFF
jgi:outer membrane scaffolding protein for murein synthesis (MipA/OmpV family)